MMSVDTAYSATSHALAVFIDTDPGDVKIFTVVDATTGVKNVRVTDHNEVVDLPAGMPLAASNLKRITVVGGDGGDQIDLSGITAADFTSLHIASGLPVVKINCGAGDDTIIGSELPDRIYAAAGDDVIHGGGGNDLIYGGSGNNYLYGDAGNDAIHSNPSAGNLGHDVIEGGQGDDTYFDSSGQGQYIFGAGDLGWDTMATSSLVVQNFSTLDFRGVGQAVAFDFNLTDQQVTPNLGMSFSDDGGTPIMLIHTLYGSGYADTITGSGLDTIVAGLPSSGSTQTFNISGGDVLRLPDAGSQSPGSSPDYQVNAKLDGSGRGGVIELGGNTLTAHLTLDDSALTGSASTIASFDVVGQGVAWLRYTIQQDATDATLWHPALNRYGDGDMTFSNIVGLPSGFAWNADSPYVPPLSGNSSAPGPFDINPQTIDLVSSDEINLPSVYDLADLTTTGLIVHAPLAIDGSDGTIASGPILHFTGEGVPTRLIIDDAALTGSASHDATFDIQTYGDVTLAVSATQDSDGVWHITLTRTGDGWADILGVANVPAGFTLAVAGGYNAVLSDPGTATELNLSMDVSGSGTQVYFYTDVHLDSLSLGSGTQATLAATHHKRLVVNRLWIETTPDPVHPSDPSKNIPLAQLDLADNALVIHNGGLHGDDLQNVTRTVGYLLHSGFLGGAYTWAGQGITSSVAASDPHYVTGLGFMQNNNAVFGATDGTTADETAGNAFYNFIGRQFYHVLPTSGEEFEALNLNDTLVMFTYTGDGDQDHTITAADYANMDLAWAHQQASGNQSGWVNGDWDGDGQITGGDYSAIDSAYGWTMQAKYAPLTLPSIALQEGQTDGVISLFDYFGDLVHTPADLQYTVTSDNASLFAGPLVPDGDGMLSLNFAPYANGSATVTITARDPNGGFTQSGTVAITVSAVDDVPEVSPIPSITNNAALSEDDQGNIWVDFDHVAGTNFDVNFHVEATNHDSANGRTLKYVLQNAPAGASIDSATGEVSWTVDNPNAPLVDKFTVRVFEMDGTTELTYVEQDFFVGLGSGEGFGFGSGSWSNCGDSLETWAPIARDDLFIVGENSQISNNVLDNDRSHSGESLEIIDASSVAPSHADEFHLYDDGSFDYTPAAGFIGTDAFTYTIRDETGHYWTATVTFDVVELAELTADVGVVPATTMTFSGSSASFSVPVQSSSGILTGIRIAPPEDSRNPYVWQADFNASVASNGSSAVLTFSTSGAYLVAVDRSYNGVVNTQFINVNFNCIYSGKVVEDDGHKYVVQDVPEGLLLASSDFKDYTHLYKNPVGITSVQSAIDEIVKYRKAHPGNNPFSVVIIDHGSPGSQLVGADDGVRKVGKVISGQPEDAVWTASFAKACKDNNVGTLYLLGCNLAGTATGVEEIDKNTQAKGDAFLKTLSSSGHVRIFAYSGYVKHVDVSSSGPRLLLQKGGALHEVFSDGSD